MIVEAAHTHLRQARPPQGAVGAPMRLGHPGWD
jgi:hypothetical protein